MTKQRIFLWLAMVIGLALQFAFIGKGERMPTPANTYTWLGMGGSIILLMACALFAEEKGYSRNFGLFAFLSIFGVVLLALLPRKSKC